MTETTARHALPLLAAGQAQKEFTHNEALALLDIAANPAVIAAGIDEPPPGAAIGDCWIVGDDPVGAWAGEPGSIAGWTGGGWRFVRPVEGMTAWIVGARVRATFDGGALRIGDVRGSALFIDGSQVAGGRLPGIPDPAGGATIDMEARTTVAAILSRLREHGLIDA